MGRVAGQMIEAMYALLTHDAEILSHLLPGQDPPAPLLYDAETHRKHRQGGYTPLKLSPKRHPMTLLPPAP